MTLDPLERFYRLPSVGPYAYVSRDSVRADGRFRLVLYGAYNARGLIGSECNGVAVLDEVERAVVADEVAREGTGWGGPSARQRLEFDRLLALDDAAFRAEISAHPRARYSIE